MLCVWNHGICILVNCLQLEVLSVCNRNLCSWQNCHLSHSKTHLLRFFLWGQFSYIRGDVGMYSIFKCFSFRENEKWTSVLRTVKKTSFKVGFKKSILFWIIFSFLWYPYKLFILENGYTNYLLCEVEKFIFIFLNKMQFIFFNQTTFFPISVKVIELLATKKPWLNWLQKAIAYNVWVALNL